MDIKANLQLNIPINFHNICTIYPLSVIDTVTNDSEFIAGLFLPYRISKEVLIKSNESMGIFEIIMNDEYLYQSLILSLVYFCRTKNIKVNKHTLEIFIDDVEQSINRDNFDELSEVLLTIGKKDKLTKQKEDEIPKFETDEGYQRWKKLQEMRQKSVKKEGLELYEIIHYVQFGSGSYIHDDEIKAWTYWKLITAYITIIGIDNYNKQFQAYLQCGDKKLIEKHWSEIIKI